ncbi:Dyslexia-associated protein KIAA0319-like protein [Chionoecetes opilio]|uniref:Dyslexia-associated protein KIAA0319-like protein n=1 Tax=Chionoecetes opilio TaxID=41210 RepID=A0A8J4XWD2_CHIOP|nr:Dyslexia-associated protein KIAA0319-like protein [Chionoecetes opilio]
MNLDLQCGAGRIGRRGRGRSMSWIHRVNSHSLIGGSSVVLLALVLAAVPCTSHSLDALLVKALHSTCPLLDPEVHHGRGVAENMSGKREVVASARDLSACVSACCSRVKCGVAVLQGEMCLALECHSLDACPLVPVNGSQAVVVQPGSDAEVVQQLSTNATHMESKDGVRPGEAVRVTDHRCEMYQGDCGPHGVCEPLGDRRKDGLCRCETSYQWDAALGGCVSISTKVPSAERTHTTTLSPPSTFTTQNASSAAVTPSPGKDTTSEPVVEKLLVKINNKTVELSEGSNIYKGEVTLSAFAIGGDSDHKYDKYEWQLLDPKSDDTGSVSDLRSQTITLSHLSQGVYVFKVEVTAAGAHGEAVGNVTVKLARHTNQPPKAIIAPPSQIIKLPTSAVIIDGSGSTDDDGIVSYAWETVTAPLGYKLKDSEQAGATLQLTDLMAGNYTIMLCVKDKEGLEGNATTFLNVIKETDYPPNANAGGDQIIYLPKTEIVVCGNQSTDDHGIEEWEWTKGPKDSGKAVDMQGQPSRPSRMCRANHHDPPECAGPTITTLQNVQGQPSRPSRMCRANHHDPPECVGPTITTLQNVQGQPSRPSRMCRANHHDPPECAGPTITTLQNV